MRARLPILLCNQLRIRWHLRRAVGAPQRASERECYDSSPDDPGKDLFDNRKPLGWSGQQLTTAVKGQLYCGKAFEIEQRVAKLAPAT